MAHERQLKRLSRDRLLGLCLKWTRSSDSVPYLKPNRHALEAQEEDYLYEPAESRKQLRNIYQEKPQASVGLASLSKNELVERIVHGDWQRGLSYEQLADVDFELLRQDDAKLRWSALELVPLEDSLPGHDEERSAKRRKLTCAQGDLRKTQYPSVHPVQFVKSLREHTSKLVKLHTKIEHLGQHDLSVVRLQIAPGTPFMPLSSNTPRSRSISAERSGTIFVALPNSCPYIYVSVSSATRTLTNGVKAKQALIGMAASKRIILEAIPKALSAPQDRWSLCSTNLISTNLRSMTAMRSSMRDSSTGGSMALLHGHSLTASSSPRTGAQTTPADSRPCRRQESDQRATLVESRFGPMDGASHVALPRFQVRVRSMMNSSAVNTSTADQTLNEERQTSASASITLTGVDVLAGLRQLARDHPVSVDIDRLPGAMTGEVGCSFVNV